jgi:hypothetical protein
MRTIIIAAAVIFSSSLANAACGQYGGPGFRGPDGKCVSWVNIGAVCGSPPTTRCTPEIVRRGASTAAKYESKSK